MTCVASAHGPLWPFTRSKIAAVVVKTRNDVVVLTMNNDSRNQEVEGFRKSLMGKGSTE
jgi:hypothetical protein